MHWVRFSVILFLLTVLQSTVAPFVAVHTIRPDFMVIFAVYCALCARTHDALFACWIIGLLIDLAGLSYSDRANVGFHALALGLAGLVIVKTRNLTFREGMASHLFYTFLTTFLLTTVLGWHMLYGHGAWNRFGEYVMVALYTAAYTSILAPYGHWFLKQLRGILGIGPTHRMAMR